MTDRYSPRPEDKFTFGLWTVGNRGRDPFGDAVRAAALAGRRRRAARRGRRMGREPSRQRSRADRRHARRARPHRRATSSGACEQHGLVVPMATVNLFYDPVFRDGAFTANDARVRAYAVQKTMRAMDLGAELGAKIVRALGRARGNGNRCLPPPGRGRQAPARGRRTISASTPSTGSTDIGSRSRPSPTSRAATSTWRRPARYLGLHRDARPPRDGRREPGSRARTDGRAELPACRRAGVGGRQAVSHRSERPGARPLRSGLPLRRRQPQGARSSWSSSWRTSATTARGTSTRTPTARKTTTA